MPTINTKYGLGPNDVVQIVDWQSDTAECRAVINEDNKTYTYTSTLDGDDDTVVAETPMSLADCVLAASVHLGLIPPVNFDPIECPNHH